MISNKRNHGNSEITKIIKDDIYKVRKYPQDYFDFIVDIGANIGVFSIMMRMLHPHAKIYAFEPAIETFEYLKKNTNMLEIDLYQIALGNGNKLYFKDREQHLLCTKFIEAPSEQTYEVESLTLPNIFSKLKLDTNKRYLLKIDCEGGEKYLVNDELSESIIQKSIQTSLEIHFKSPSTEEDFWLDYNTYDDWIRSKINKHTIEYYCSNRKRGYGHYCMRRQC